ncbi:Uncharacterised protein [uncultured archaeon]|nr:Uncharacterised protein [uncultured archaeon]
MKRIIILLTIAALTISAAALRNPAAVYCSALGHNYTVEQTEDGYVGYCEVSGQNIDAWNFLQGKEAQNESYCAKNYLRQKVTNDSSKCLRLMTDTCLVCIKDGQEVEVTEAMGLSFLETTCGDKHCGFPENSQTCPADCPSGGLDNLCDGVKDGICDKDCVTQNNTQSDPDCAQTTSSSAIIAGGIFGSFIALAIIALIIVVLIIFVAFKMMRKRKK